MLEFTPRGIKLTSDTCLVGTGNGNQILQAIQHLEAIMNGGMTSIERTAAIVCILSYNSNSILIQLVRV